MKIDKMFETVSTVVDYDCFIKEIGSLSDFNTETQEVLKFLYSSTGNQLRMATIINSIFHQNLQTFMFSKPILNKLYEKDNNISLNSLNTHQYKAFFENFKSCGVFVVLRESTNNRAGVYKLVQNELVALLHKNCSQKFFDGQEKFAVDYFDNYDQHKNKKVEIQAETTPEEKIKRKEQLKERIRKQGSL